MKIAIISGINYPEFVEYGDIAFTLCDWINNSKEYTKYYKKSSQYKITDNMAAEKGKSSSILEVIKAARKVKANEIWASDKLYDKNETQKLTLDFLSKLSSEDKKQFKIVGLPQGKDFKEWMESYKWMLEDNRIDVIAISKYSVEAFSSFVGTKNFALCRIACIKYLHDNGLVLKPLHIAGANNLIIYEIQEYKKYPMVRSVDSNIAFKLGVMRIKIEDCINEPIERLDHNIKNLDEEQLNIIKHNINKIKEAL